MMSTLEFRRMISVCLTPGAGSYSRPDCEAGLDSVCEVDQGSIASQVKGDSIVPVGSLAFEASLDTEGNSSRLRAGKRRAGLAERASSVHGAPGSSELKAEMRRKPPKGIPEELQVLPPPG